MPGRAVQEMIDEEAKPNLTPMIDVVFLLLIFFMLMKFKTYEEKLDSHLPKDEGMEATDPELAENIVIALRPMNEEGTQINIHLQNLQGTPIGAPIPWAPVDRQDGDHVVQAADPAMFLQLERLVTDQLQAGNIDSKVVLAPDPVIPFDYVALTLDAVHKALKEWVGNDRMAKIRSMDAEASALRMRGDHQGARRKEDERNQYIEDLRTEGVWKDVTFEAPPMD